MNRKFQKGYTLIELLLALFMLLCCIGVIALVWAAVHFIIKHW